MKKWLVVSALLAGVAGLLLVGMAASAHTHTFPSNVTIHRVGPNVRAVHGRVYSARPDCRKHRQVQVFRKQPGPDLAVTPVANTGDDAKWGPLPVPSAGRYYAHIEPIPTPNGSGYGHHHTCGGHTSPAIQVK